MATILQNLARILTTYKVPCKIYQILTGLNYKFLARALCRGILLRVSYSTIIPGRRIFFFPNLNFDPLKLSIMYKIIARYCMECLLIPLKSLASVGKFACQNFGGACHSIIWPTHMHIIHFFKGLIF